MDVGLFPLTSWSAIWLARAASPEAASVGLERLCRTYWQPIVAVIRLHGHDAILAEDLAQRFLSRAVANGLFGQADPVKGRLRAFLGTALKRFLIDEHRRAKLPMLPLPADEAGGPVDARSPDREFDRRWAEALLERALVELELDYTRRGRRKLFLRLEPSLQSRDRPAESQAALAAEFGLTEGALKAEVYRLRQRFRLLIRAEIAATVATTAEVEEELRYLFQVFSR